MFLKVFSSIHARVKQSSSSNSGSDNGNSITITSFLQCGCIDVRENAPFKAIVVCKNFLPYLNSTHYDMLEFILLHTFYPCRVYKSASSYLRPNIIFI